MMFELREVPKNLLLKAHNSDQRDKLRFFKMGWEASQSPGEQVVHLFETDSGEQHRIVAGEVTGPFAWKQTPVDLRVARFKDVVFGHGSITLNGRVGHIVLTLQDGETAMRGAIELTTEPPEDREGDAAC